ncbi:MAG: hypothetical protein HC906_07225 [Bacteroidales bacterium]|nr:hypothetical protein [Bacteroidales bacterium]
MDRRKFITEAGRYAMFAGLTATGTIVLLRNRNAKDNCTKVDYCRQCGQLKSCENPQSFSFK